MKKHAESWTCSVCVRNFDIKIPIGIEIKLTRDVGDKAYYPYRYGTYRVCFPCWLNSLEILPTIRLSIGLSWIFQRLSLFYKNLESILKSRLN